MSQDSYKQFILGQLAPFGDVECRAMFGSLGLSHRGVFFGIIHQDRLYFKTTPATRVEYQRRGMEPFQPNPRQTLKSFYEVPAEIVEDDAALARWASQATGGDEEPDTKVDGADG